MDYTKQKTFSIHFPGNRVYIENTCKSFYDKMEYIKQDKDHILYPLFQEYPNPEIVVECYIDGTPDRKKLVFAKYKKESYKILNPQLFPSPSLFQFLYKWMSY